MNRPNGVFQNIYIYIITYMLSRSIFTYDLQAQPLEMFKNHAHIEKRSADKLAMPKHTKHMQHQ